jgi:hypothetical protein
MSEHRPRRDSLDFYPTPPEGTRALLSVERFDGTIWEPACGDGAIAKVFVRAGYRVVATDLVDRGYGESGVNFLTEPRSRARHIVTNPPFGRGLADRFIRHALHLTRDTGGSVVMLVDLASLAHPVRTAMWIRRPPAAIYIVDELVFRPGHRPDALPVQTRFAWCVWKPGHIGRPSLWWLSTARFRNRIEKGRRR